jgi:hypothetical protein
MAAGGGAFAGGGALAAATATKVAALVCAAVVTAGGAIEATHLRKRDSSRPAHSTSSGAGVSDRRGTPSRAPTRAATRDGHVRDGARRVPRTSAPSQPTRATLPPAVDSGGLLAPDEPLPPVSAPDAIGSPVPVPDVPVADPVLAGDTVAGGSSSTDAGGSAGAPSGSPAAEGAGAGQRSAPAPERSNTDAAASPTPGAGGVAPGG